MPGGAAPRRKGFGWEREVAQRMTRVTGCEWKRGLAQTRDATETADVISTCSRWERWWIECKRGKLVNVRAALRQAEDAAGPQDFRVVIAKDDQRAPMAVMPLEDFEALVGLLSMATSSGCGCR